jgi:hypothetical protein
MHLSLEGIFQLKQRVFLQMILRWILDTQKQHHALSQN